MMNYSKHVRTALVVFLVMGVALGCRKKYNYSFSDGFPGDGGDSASFHEEDTSFSKIDRSKFREARQFPGLVGEHVPRIKDSLITLDMQYNNAAKTMRVAAPPGPMFSTGLYAPPGELVEITVPNAMRSLTVQVGAWTDNLNNHANPLRDPVISTKQKLHPGKNYVRNLYGGTIYIWTDHSISHPVSLSFTGAVKSPDYVLGKTDPQEWWNMVQHTQVPFLEFRSPNIIILLNRSRIIKNHVDYPKAIMTFWNNAIQKDYFDWMGLKNNPTDPKNLAPDLPFRAVGDIQISGGTGHSGFPIMYTDNSGWFHGFVDTNRVYNMKHRINPYNEIGYGYFHEFGHDMQQSSWTWGPQLTECTNGLFAIHAIQRIQKKIDPSKPMALYPYIHPSVLNDDKMLAYAEGGGEKNFDEDFASGAPGLPFVQLMVKLGDSVITRLYTASRHLKRWPVTHLDKHDFMYKVVSNFAKKNCITFFNAWGIRVSQQAQDEIADKGYPLLTQTIWTYNPLTDTGGNGTFNPYNPSHWKIEGYSSAQAQSGQESPGSILDGDPSTYWSSQWSPMIEPPHSVTVDMKRPLRVNTFYFIQRDYGAVNIKNVEIKVSDDGENWRSKGTFHLEQNTNIQEVHFQQTETFRYFKLIIPSVSDIYSNSSVSLAEVWADET